ncbi:hypothetical protein ACJIZ3_001588 [Penstemon smallii]|uniref:Uncharacterized protein n=1 Tax=Penstemon smallii TaxID=265156 RepID=A0ABD3U5C7_9LAMI
MYNNLSVPYQLAIFPKPLQNPGFNHSYLHHSTIMATRYRTMSRPAINLLKSTFTKPTSRPAFSAQSARSSPSLFSRPLSQMGALQSLLPLHSAVSSARLTSCLGADANGCRSLSQGMLCSANPGV